MAPTEQPDYAALEDILQKLKLSLYEVEHQLRASEKPDLSLVRGGADDDQKGD